MIYTNDFIVYLKFEILFFQQHSKIAYEIVELDIESNHGNLEYTCLYRIRVHGKVGGSYDFSSQFMLNKIVISVLPP